jgi:hypothetical protein
VIGDDDRGTGQRQGQGIVLETVKLFAKQPIQSIEAINPFISPIGSIRALTVTDQPAP